MARFQTLVDVYHDSVKTFPDNPLFGTKRGGVWEWMTYLRVRPADRRLPRRARALGVKRGDRSPSSRTTASSGRSPRTRPTASARVRADVRGAARRRSGSSSSSDCEAKVAHRRDQGDPREDARRFLDTIPGARAHHQPRRRRRTATASVTTYKALARDEGRTSPPSSREPKDIALLHLHVRHDRQPQGRHPHARQHRVERQRRPRVLPVHGEDDRSLSFLPWAHSFGQTCELHGLLLDGRVAWRIGESVDKIIDNLAEVKPTLLFSVPRIFNSSTTRCRSRSRASPAFDPERSSSAALAARREEARRRAPLARRARSSLALADKLVFSKVRERFGGQLEVRVQRRRGDLDARSPSSSTASASRSTRATASPRRAPIATANCPGDAQASARVGKPIPGVQHRASTRLGHGRRRSRARSSSTARTSCRATTTAPRRTTRSSRRTAASAPATSATSTTTASSTSRAASRSSTSSRTASTSCRRRSRSSSSSRRTSLNVMVYGDNKPYNVALVVAERRRGEEVGRRATASSESDPTKLLANPKVREALQERAREATARSSRASRA